MLRQHHEPRARGYVDAYDQAESERVLALEALLNDLMPSDEVDHAAAICADAKVAREPLSIGDGPGAEALARQLAVLLPALGLEPSSVALQIDERAAAIARAHGSIGVTIAGRVYLDDAAFDPCSAAGREVLAHELTHVAQWRLGRSRGVAGDAELEAASMARLWVGGHAPSRPMVGLGSEPATFMLIESVLKGIGSQLRQDFFGTLAEQLAGTVGDPLVPTLERWAAGELEAPEEIPEDEGAMEKAAEALGEGSVEALEATGKVTLFFIRAFFGILNKLKLLPIGFRSEAGPFALQVGGTATFKTIEMWGRVEVDFAALHDFFSGLGIDAIVAAGVDPLDALGSKKAKVDDRRDVHAIFPWKDPIGGWSVSLPPTDTAAGGWESVRVDMQGLAIEEPRVALPFADVMLEADRFALGTSNELTNVRTKPATFDLALGSIGALEQIALRGDVDLAGDAGLECEAERAWVSLMGMKLALGRLGVRVSRDGVRVGTGAVAIGASELEGFWAGLGIAQAISAKGLSAELSSLDDRQPRLSISCAEASLSLFGQTLTTSLSATVDATGLSGALGATKVELGAGAFGVGFAMEGATVDANGFTCTPITCRVGLSTFELTATIEGVRYGADGFEAGDTTFKVGALTELSLPGASVVQLLERGPSVVDWSSVAPPDVTAAKSSGTMKVLNQNAWYDANGVPLEGDYQHPLAIAWVTVLRDLIRNANAAITEAYDGKPPELYPEPDPTEDPVPWIKPFTSWVSSQAALPAPQRATSYTITVMKEKKTIDVPKEMATLAGVPMLPSSTSCKLTCDAMLDSAGAEQDGKRDYIWNAKTDAGADGFLDRACTDIANIRQRARDAVVYLNATLPTPVIVGVNHKEGDVNEGHADHWVVVYEKRDDGYRFADPAGGKCYTFTVDADGILVGKGWKRYEVQTVCHSKVADPPPEIVLPPAEIAAEAQTEEVVQETGSGESQQSTAEWFWENVKSLWTSASEYLGSQPSEEPELPPETDAVVTEAGTVGPPIGATRAEVLAETGFARAGADPTKASKSTLEIDEGLVKNEADNDSTKYATGTESADRKKIESGADDIKLMKCSSLSGWVLAAAGYDIAKALCDRDGKAFRYHEVTLAPNAKKPNAAAVTYFGYGDYEGQQVYPYNDPYDITARMLIDGQGEAVLAMRTIIDHHGGDLEALVGVCVHIPVTPGVGPIDNAFTGAFASDAEGGTNLAVTGAAAAFELMGIGAQVAPTEARPGDFAQAHGNKSGSGHAYQIYRVQGFGSGWFGPGAEHPTLVGEAAPKERTWRDDVTLIIDDHTLPENVGAFVVEQEERIEVNIAARNDETVHEGSDNGGAGTSDFKMNGAAEGTSLEFSFYARLRESKWYTFVPAEPPAGSKDTIAEKTRGLEALVKTHVDAGETDTKAITNAVIREAFGDVPEDDFIKAVSKDVRYRLVRDALITRSRSAAAGGDGGE